MHFIFIQYLRYYWSTFKIILHNNPRWAVPSWIHVARPLRGSARARRRFRPPMALALGGWAA